MTDESPSLSLLKGAKPDVAAELASAPAPEAEPKLDIAKLTSAQLDGILKENEVDPPEGWSTMKVAEKRKWFTENFDVADDGTPDTPPAEAPTPVGAQATAEASTPTPTPTPSPAPSEAAPKETVAVSEDAPAEAPPATKKKGKSKAVAVSDVVNGEVMEPDAIASMVQQIENMKEADAKAAVVKLADAGEIAQFKLGGVLALIQSHGWYKPYASFREYVEQDIGMHYRKATYWVGIYNCLIEANIPWEKVKKVGWTKLKEIAEVLTVENVDHWVKTALANNTITLIDIVKAYKQQKAGVKSIEGETTKEVTTMTFKVHAGQKETIKAAIDKAKSDSGTTVDTMALEYICADFLGGMSMTSRLTTIGMEAAFAAIETAFPNVKLSAEVTDEPSSGSDQAAA